MARYRDKLTMLSILLEEEDDDDWIKYMFAKRKRLPTKEMYKRRRMEGVFNTLVTRHLFNDHVKFKEYFRITPEQFKFVLGLIEEDVSKLSTTFVQRPITAAERLSITLRYMATGESFRSLAFAFRISHSHISKLIREVLKALCEKLAPIYLPNPTKEKMESIAAEFNDLWNFPNCCGAIDGKHCRIVCPNKSGSLYYNYKNFYSLVLLALVDARYRFIAIDVGSFGKEGDSGIYQKSNIKKMIPALMPEDSPLPGTGIFVPHVIVGDEGFHLSRNLMRPYPKSQAIEDISKRTFNYRLCRARRTAENAFGIMSQTFRVLFTPIAVKPDTVDLLITACCCLHNMLRSLSNDFRDEEITQPTENMIALARVGGNNSVESFNVRETFKNYFCSVEGRLTWFQ